MYCTLFRQIGRLNYIRAKRRRLKGRGNFESLQRRPKFSPGRKKDAVVTPRLSTVARRRRIVTTAWLWSLVLNALILIWVAMLPTLQPVAETALQVDVVSLQKPSPLKRRAQALSRLVYAMNRWTNVRTQLLSETMPLASPEIHQIPLVYIAARDAFTFSEKERANLRSYLQSGGTLLFSDVSTAWGIDGPVANSIRFEV